MNWDSSNASPVKTDHRIKLSDDDVLEIRMRYGAGETQSELANAYSVSQTQISKIVRFLSRGQRSHARSRPVVGRPPCTCGAR